RRARSLGHRREYESHRRLLRQRRRRELLRVAQGRVGRPRGLLDARSGGRLSLRVHRPLLQPDEAAFSPRVRESDRVRIEISTRRRRGIVNPSTESGEDQSARFQTIRLRPKIVSGCLVAVTLIAFDTVSEAPLFPFVRIRSY